MILFSTLLSAALGASDGIYHISLPGRYNTANYCKRLCQ